MSVSYVSRMFRARVPSFCTRYGLYYTVLVLTVVKKKNANGKTNAATGNEDTGIAAATVEPGPASAALDAKALEKIYMDTLNDIDDEDNDEDDDEDSEGDGCWRTE